uniref:mucin-15 isoform X2 n=1 Tax=Doryrhamphus excisus TaxID=161450 RepID=UPI0025ADD134|nr:mucin-15 isoform X2 [Doryrhamphus excisus]
MELLFKITICLLLLVHTFNLVSLQNSTNSPRHTIDQSWNREQSSDAEEEEENKPGGDVSPMQPSNDVSSVTYNGENHVGSKEQSENETAHDSPVATTAEPPTSANTTKEQPEVTNGTRESNQNNVTRNKEELNNSTKPPLTPSSHPFDGNSTTNPERSNGTDIESTSLPPEVTNPNDNTTAGNDTEPNNVTQSATTTVTTTTRNKINKTSTTSPPEVLPSDPTKLFPEVTTTVASETPKGNLTDKQASAGSSSERVLRLDNSDPLDLNFGGSAYYNPGLQGDNIQMSNIPGRKTN